MQYVTDALAAVTSDAELETIRAASAIAVAIVGALGIIIVGILNRTRQHAKATRSDVAIVKGEVKNDHPTNLRDEADDRHRELLNEVRAVKATVESQGKAIVGLNRSVGGIRDEIRGMREDDRQVRSELDEERKRIRHLEDTRPGKAPS